MDPEKYRDFLIFLFLHSKNGIENIISEIRSSTLPGKDGILDLILAAYDAEPHEIKPLKGAEYLYATFFEALKAEAVLAEKKITDDVIAEAAKVAMDSVTPIDDVRGSARYRKYMVRNLTREAITEVWKKIS